MPSTSQIQQAWMFLSLEWTTCWESTI